MAYRAPHPRLSAWLDAGLHAHQAGDIDRALAVYRQILSAAPEHPAALNLLGTGLLQLGQAADALPYLERASRCQRDNAQLLGNLAEAYLALRRYGDACQTFRKASRLVPAELRFQAGIAAALAMDGKLEEAEAILQRLAVRFPDSPIVWFNLGNLMRDTRRPEAAAHAYRKALELDPHMADARNSLGSVLHSMQRFADAETEYRRCLEAAPDFLLPRYNLASVTMDLGRFAEAEKISRDIVARAPHVAEAHRLVGTAIAHQSRLLEALPWYRNAAAIAPDDAPSARGYGIALMETGHVAAGLRWLARAAALTAGTSASEVAASGALLAHASFRDGWKAYADRSAAVEFRAKNPGVPLLWTLPEDLSGKRVCVLAEQGLGDQLFFLRYSAQLAARGASVVHRAERKLHTLLQRVASLHEVRGADTEMPQADFHVLAGDLPAALYDPACSALPGSGSLPTPADVAEPPRHPSVFWPLPAATLRIDPLAHRLAEMRERLAALGPPPYIGVTWRGGIPPEKQQTAAWLLYKAIALPALAGALRNVRGTLLALQREPSSGELEALAAALARPVHDLASLNDDLEGMLAVLALADEYIGVSNTNMHLRAAVGRTARVLVPVPAEWRWVQSGRASPWFPGFSIYRQSLGGDWSEALAALAHDLVESFSAGARSNPPA